MANLRPARPWARIWTSFVPKELKAHARAEVLPDGQVELTPLFEIDGCEIWPPLIGQDSTQRILGYQVTLDSTALLIHKKTCGKPTRLSKSKAAQFIEELEKDQVRITSRDGKSPVRIARVKPDVTLTLQPDDVLVVEPELVSSEGIVLEKPPNLEQMREDEGWYAVGDDLIMAMTTGTALDALLISPGERSTLIGQDVPNFLKQMQNHPNEVGNVERNEPLQSLSVFGEETENRARVDGDSDSVSVSPVLVFHGPTGKRYVTKPDRLKGLEKNGGFSRVADGWIDVSPTAVQDHLRACRELAEKIGGLDDIRGEDIPNVLTSLVQVADKGGDWNTPWTVYFSKSVQDSHRIIDSPAAVQFRMNIIEADGQSLLELDPIYEHERFHLSHSETETATQKGGGWCRRGDAWIRVDAEKHTKIANEIERLGLQRTKEGFSFRASQREQIIETFSTLGSIQHSNAYADFLSKLLEFEKIEDVPPPDSLRPGIMLRPYQKHGLNWLAFLHQFGLNGILADDMGLGKTLQCLAVIQRAKQKAKANLPSLIICPTSVVQNWKSEAEKFFLKVRAITYTGSNRGRIVRRIRSLMNVDCRGTDCMLVITSYDIARKDHQTLAEIPWLYVVADEAHLIKNPVSKRTRAIKTLNGRHKLALTGTPIQNNLEELWSLFDFVMPGFLGSRNQFRDDFGPKGRIDPDSVCRGAESLKQRIKPFVLRRLKENVAKDLPEKILIEHKVELKPRQVAIYKKVIDGAECRKLFQDVRQTGVRPAEPGILVAYARLRSICNHPDLDDGESDGRAAGRTESGKLERLWELIDEIVDGEHRALLFCQSTRMLDIIERHLSNDLQKRKKGLIRLDGRTPPDHRPLHVDRFNNDCSIAMFLISTRAGGCGLNLTGADTVIFYDHDWNPANDDQAENRAHRIGQTKPVTVYKLVSKGTIEEKILERQTLKKALVDQIIDPDHNVFKNLSAEELFNLFKLDVG